MPRLYTVPFDNVSVAAAQDLWELTPADDKPIAVIGIWLDNVGGTADMGDAQEEGLRLGLIRGYTASGSGGSSVTPADYGKCGTAAGFTAEANNTTLATTGTQLNAVYFGWNPRIPMREWLPENAWFPASQGDTTLCVRLIAAPADTFPCSGTLWVLEYP